MHPPITIFCAFTRQWAVDQWLENLTATQHDPALTNLCIIVDGDQQLIANTIKKFAEKHSYRSFHVKVNTDWHPNEVRLAIRRARVAEVHNQSKDLIAKTDGDLIVGLEDDTVFDRNPNWLLELITSMADDVGFIEGIQMGRWGANMVGVWQFDDIHKPRQVKTLLPPDDGIARQEITGGGFYGYVTRRHLYLDHDYYTSTSQPWGPDVNYGVWVRQQGYKCYADWTIVFGHNDYNRTLYPDDRGVRLAQIVYTKNELTGKWDRTDHEQTRY